MPSRATTWIDWTTNGPGQIRSMTLGIAPSSYPAPAHPSLLSGAERKSAAHPPGRFLYR
jgi:hypothetical protein